MPAIVKDLRPEFDEGPVLVTVEYHVNGDRTEEFLEAIHEYGRVRRRDGAYRWGVYRDLEEAERYVETFLVASWAEHLRQHERSTKADREIEERLWKHVTGVPTVRHLVAADAERSSSAS
jgi:transmembrane secretion effector